MKSRGFTITEVLVAAGIAALIMAALAVFLQDALGLSRDALASMNAELDGRRVLREITYNLRSAETVEATSTDSISFDSGKAIYLDSASGELRFNDGETLSTLVELENGTTTPLFEHIGRFVRVHLLIGGRSYESGFTFRNLD